MPGGLDDAATLADLFQDFGPVRPRRMFGGAGLYRDGLMFALIADDLIYMKVDAANAAAFREAGSEPFVYEAKGKQATMSYWRVPDAAYDDPAEMAAWARLGFEAALRTQAAKAKKPAGVSAAARGSQRLNSRSVRRPPPTR